MPSTVIADTGFWLALANKRDTHHGAATAWLADNPGLGLVTTWPTVTETCHLLIGRIGPQAQLRFVDSLRQGVAEVFALGPSHWPRISRLMQDYADLPMDLADASLVILAEHLGHGRILSTDIRDFRAYRWKERQPFENLLPH